MCDLGLGLAIAGVAIAGTTAVQGARTASATADAQGDAAAYNQKVTGEYNADRYAQEGAYRTEMLEHQNEVYTENSRRVVDSALRGYDVIQDRLEQERHTAGREITQIARQSRAVQSQATAGAADREVAGPSVDYLLDAIAFNELEAAENVRQEQKWRFDSMMSAMDDIEAQSQAQIDSANPQPIPLPALPAPMGTQGFTQPSSFAYILQGVGGALNAFSTFYNPAQQLGTTPPTPPQIRPPGTVTGGQLFTGWHSPKPSWVD